MVRVRRACAFAALLAWARVASAQPTFPAHDVQIAVTVHDAASADVVEQYALTSPLNDAPFSLFAPPCTGVGPIAATLGDRRLPVDAGDTSHAPWTTLRLGGSSIGGRAGEVLTLRYDVRMAGSDATVPLALPSAVLQRAGGARGAAVRIDLRIDDVVEYARVRLPRLDRAARDRAWHGLFLAVPSFIRVELPGAARCDRPLAGSAGGLEWRTAVFAGTMATWVPIYLWWFGRWRRTN